MPWWAILLAALALEAAQIAAIILLAKQSARWRALVRGATADLQKLLDIQHETNKPLPDDPVAVRKLMDE